MNFALNGAASLEANKPAEAVAAYTKALIEHPTSPDYYIQRSTAFTRVSPPRHDLALQDAEKAVLYAYQRSKRNSIQAAQHRRVVSLYNLGRYADAKHILETMRGWVKEDDKKGKMQVDMWTAKAENKLKTATDEQKVFIVEEKPSIQLPTEKERLNLLKRQIHIDGTYNFDWEKRGPSATPEAVDADKSVSEAENGTPIHSNTSSPSTGKIRHEWYQNAHSVIITLYAKGVPKDKTQIDIQEDAVSCHKLGSGHS
jgi:suppressor of G2 allele of SKP1